MEYYEYEIRNNLDKYPKGSDVSKIADLFWALGFPKGLDMGFRKFETLFNGVKDFGLESLNTKNLWFLPYIHKLKRSNHPPQQKPRG